jgi:hypothetical protein
MESYVNIKNKEVVKILNDAGNFYILNNGMKVDKQLFNQTYAPLTETVQKNVSNLNADTFLNSRTPIQTINKKQEQQTNDTFIVNNTQEEVNPLDFFTAVAPISGIDNIKNVDTSKIIDPPKGQQTQIRDLSKENAAPTQNVNTTHTNKQQLLEQHRLEHPELYKNIPYQESEPIPVEQKPKETILNENGLTEYQEIFRQQQIETIGEDPYADKIKKYKEKLNKPVDQIIVGTNKNKNKIDVDKHVIPTDNIVEPVDPTIALFKNFKRNYDIKISLNIENKITNPDFVKLMADNLEGDIIQYYTDDIYDNFIKNSNVIKTEIYNQINVLIYGDDVKIKKINENKSVVKPKTTSKTTPKAKSKTTSKTPKTATKTETIK